MQMKWMLIIQSMPAKLVTRYRVAIVALRPASTGSAGDAGATANLKLTFTWTTQRGLIRRPRCVTLDIRRNGA
jgi:hypothetical protein